MQALLARAAVMHARDDDVASLRNAQLIERRVKAPVETVILDDSYHMITVDQQRRLVIEKSASFFKRIAAAENASANSDAPNETTGSP